MSMPKVSVVICTYNRVQHIQKSIDALIQQTADKQNYELIIVDNNSTDGTTQKILESMIGIVSPNIRYHKEEKQGLSHARNAGIALAQGHIVSFIDDDAIAKPDFIQVLILFFESHSSASAVGGQVIPMFLNGEPEWMSSWTRKVVSEIDFGSETILLDKRYPFGANMSMRNNIFTKYGVFDPNLGRTGKNLMGGEEKDLFDRLRKGKEEIWYEPKLYVDHIIEESRLTQEFIMRFCRGVGRSERVRLEERGVYAVWKKYLVNKVKRAGSLMLGLKYISAGQPAKGKMIMDIMRWIEEGYNNPNINI